MRQIQEGKITAHNPRLHVRSCVDIALLVGSKRLRTTSLKHFFPLLCLSREAYIQVCRGLMIAAVCLGFFGATLALVGMKCTKIGGSETTKARLTVLSGFHFILSGKKKKC